MRDADDYAAWLRLLDTPGVGRDTARRLLAAFGSPDRVLSASFNALKGVTNATVAGALGKPPETFAARLQAARAWFDAEPSRRALTLGDPDYPPALLQTADPPLLLYVQGDVSLLSAPSVAVVGSRQPSAQGADNAREFARRLSDAGFVVVSGLALGVDGAAHEGALAGSRATLAVVGTGLDRVYPARHRALARRIVERGAMISEYAPGTPALPENFPQRNRIIAGLSLGTLVVEAALRSGSLITARLAVEAGREVYAIPGSIHAPQSQGCHALIRQGAMLVESADEIVADLQQRPLRSDPPSVQASGEQDAPDGPADSVLEALGHDPVSLDALMARTGFGAPELSARLLEMELDGRVARLPGGLFQRRHGA